MWRVRVTPVVMCPAFLLPYSPPPLFSHILSPPLPSSPAYPHPPLPFSSPSLHHSGELCDSREGGGEGGEGEEGGKEGGCVLVKAVFIQLTTEATCVCLLRPHCHVNH